MKTYVRENVKVPLHNKQGVQEKLYIFPNHTAADYLSPTHIAALDFQVFARER